MSRRWCKVNKNEENNQTHLERCFWTDQIPFHAVVKQMITIFIFAQNVDDLSKLKNVSGEILKTFQSIIL